MALAFFWLVIGDLITLHQKLIYGFDPFGQHQPFAKPGHQGTKNGKSQKVVKIQDNNHFLSFTSISNTTEKQNTVVSFTFVEKADFYYLLTKTSNIASRAPPAA